jgi:uncharacterized membrane protein
MASGELRQAPDQRHVVRRQSDLVATARGEIKNAQYPAMSPAFLWKQTAARWVLALFMVVAGVNHFLAPEIYLGMMPAWLPAREAANVISGAAEILGGVGLLIPRLRRAAAWGLILLLVAVFPANVHVALQGNMPGLEGVSPALLWLRLPFQAVFIGWVWWVGRDPGKTCIPPARQ